MLLFRVSPLDALAVLRFSTGCPGLEHRSDVPIPSIYGPGADENPFA
jgi:hypothetical protein